MRRRDFLTHAILLPLAALAPAACTTSATTTRSGASGSAASAGARTGRRPEIDGAAEQALEHLYANVGGARETVAKAEGVLVFPRVYAAGFWLGGQFGEGVLRSPREVLGYYSLASLSFGLQIGAQSKTIVILFMTTDALNQFRTSHGWSVGGDASVALLKVGANGKVEVGPGAGPVLAFVLTNAGLMANLTLAGTKISPLSGG